MIIAALIFGMIFGGTVTEQIHYDKCKKVNFKGEVCKVEKHLKEIGDK